MRDRAPRPPAELARDAAAAASGAGHAPARRVGGTPPCARERDVVVAPATAAAANCSAGAAAPTRVIGITLSALMSTAWRFRPSYALALSRAGARRR